MALALSTLAFAGAAAFSMIATGPASAANAATVQDQGFEEHGMGHGMHGMGREREMQGPGEDFIVEEGDFFVNEEDGSNRGG
jgi:Spy/CpxP family protein refolding chaperone